MRLYLLLLLSAFCQALRPAPRLTYRGADIVVTVPGRTELHYRGTMSGAREYCEWNGIECNINE